VAVVATAVNADMIVNRVELIADPCLMLEHHDPHIYSFVPRAPLYENKIEDATTLAFPILPKSRAAFCFDYFLNHNRKNINKHNRFHPNNYCNYLINFIYHRTGFLTKDESYEVATKSMVYPERFVAFLQNWPKFSHLAMISTLHDYPICGLGTSRVDYEPGPLTQFDMPHKDININYIQLHDRYPYQIVRGKMCVEQDVSPRKLTVYVYQIQHLATGETFNPRIHIAETSDLKLIQVITNLDLKKCKRELRCRYSDDSKTCESNFFTSNYYGHYIMDKCEGCKSNYYLEFDHILPNNVCSGLLVYMLVGEGYRPHFTSSCIDYELRKSNYNPDIVTFEYNDRKYHKQCGDNSIKYSSVAYHDLHNYHFNTISLLYNLTGF
jgi:hypothetical protein